MKHPDSPADLRLLDALRPVRARLRCNASIRAIGLGWLAGALVATGLAAAAFYWPLPATAELMLAALIVGVGLGVLWLAQTWPHWPQAAAAIDRSGRPEAAHGEARAGQGTAAALEMLDDPQRTAMHDVHLAETARRVERLDPGAVVRRRWPVALAAALLLTVAGFVLLGHSVPPPPELAREPSTGSSAPSGSEAGPPAGEPSAAGEEEPIDVGWQPIAVDDPRGVAPWPRVRESSRDDLARLAADAARSAVATDQDGGSREGVQFNAARREGTSPASVQERLLIRRYFESGPLN